jgi:FSR family fosmidomycin resistance protein-like MFS transporter
MSLMFMLLIEFLDEFVFGAREAAWPLIRNDLNLTYLQVGLILSVPNFLGNLIEPVIGILGDVWKRRRLILGGGIVFTLALVLVALSHDFWLLLGALILFYPASGAFVSLSQAALMDAEPERHEQNMARWTLAGSLGIVLGPLILGLSTTFGWSWRGIFVGFAILSFLILLVTRRFKLLNKPIGQTTPNLEEKQSDGFKEGLIGAIRALKRKEILRWLTLLEFADLMLDVLHGFLALYFVDVVGFSPAQAGLALAIWTGMGLIGDLLLIPLLERMTGIKYLRISAVIVLGIFPAFLLVSQPGIKLVLIGLLGFLNAGWYAIPKGQLYSAMPDQSGTVMTVGNIFGLIGGLIPLGIGFAAQKFGLDVAIWLVIFGPLILVLGLPRTRVKIIAKED